MDEHTRLPFLFISPIFLPLPFPPNWFFLAVFLFHLLFFLFSLKKKRGDLPSLHIVDF